MPASFARSFSSFHKTKRLVLLKPDQSGHATSTSSVSHLTSSQSTRSAKRLPVRKSGFASQTTNKMNDITTPQGLDGQRPTARQKGSTTPQASFHPSSGRSRVLDQGGARGR